MSNKQCPICGYFDGMSHRSLQQLRLYFGMLRLVSEHAETHVFQGKDGPSNLHDTIKRALGYVEPMYDFAGNVIGYKAQSMAFHKKSQQDFSAFFDKAQTFIFEKILPNVEQESFERELCQMLRIPTMGDYL